MRPAASSRRPSLDRAPASGRTPRGSFTSRRYQAQATATPEAAANDVGSAFCSSARRRSQTGQGRAAGSTRLTTTSSTRRPARSSACDRVVALGQRQHLRQRHPVEGRPAAIAQPRRDLARLRRRGARSADRPPPAARRAPAARESRGARPAARREHRRRRRLSPAPPAAAACDRWAPCRRRSRRTVRCAPSARSPSGRRARRRQESRDRAARRRRSRRARCRARGSRRAGAGAPSASARRRAARRARRVEPPTNASRHRRERDDRARRRASAPDRSRR